jgi:hypothetical protein
VRECLNSSGLRQARRFADRQSDREGCAHALLRIPDMYGQGSGGGCCSRVAIRA